MEWFCFLIGLLRVSLNVSFYICINIKCDGEFKCTD